MAKKILLEYKSISDDVIKVSNEIGKKILNDAVK